MGIFHRDGHLLAARHRAAPSAGSCSPECRCRPGRRRVALRSSALNLAEGTANLGPVVVRETGTGLHIQDEGKTEGSTRTIKLPADLVARLLARQVAAVSNEWDVVFPSPRGRPRDPSNTSHDVGDLLTAAGHEWATAHTFRHTVATVLGLTLSGREVANHLGHARASMTMDRYMSRRTVSDRAADLLLIGGSAVQSVG